MTRTLLVRGEDVEAKTDAETTPLYPAVSNVIRGKLFFFSLMATKVTTQFILTSIIKTFV